jgi:hypothetical protein
MRPGDVLSIARAFELDAAFPPFRGSCSNRGAIWVAEIEKRRDLREFLIFTIDPADAKDLMMRYLLNRSTPIAIGWVCISQMSVFLSC